LWSVSIMLPNLALLYLFMPRYAAPVRMAFMVLFMAGGMSVVERVWPRLAPSSPSGGAAPCPPSSSRHQEHSNGLWT
jgi:hypothetical protein